jgi:hypothetical protein
MDNRMSGRRCSDRPTARTTTPCADAASCGFKAVIMWKGSTNDGRLDLQEGPELHPGDIILMHWRTDLYQNLLKVFDTVRTQGYSIGRLEDYLPDTPTTTVPAKSAHKKP